MLFFFPKTVRARVDALPFTKQFFNILGVSEMLFWGDFSVCVGGECISSHFVFAEPEQRLCYSHTQ